MARKQDAYIKLHALGELSGVRQDLTTLERRQGRKWSGVESRVLKPETSIHTVGRQLQRHLLDIPLQIMVNACFGDTIRR